MTHHLKQKKVLLIQTNYQSRINNFHLVVITLANSLILALLSKIIQGKNNMMKKFKELDLVKENNVKAKAHAKVWGNNAQDKWKIPEKEEHKRDRRETGKIRKSNRKT